MTYYEQAITLDISGRRQGVLLHAKQGDKDSRIIKATLVENATPYEMPEGALVEFRATKPSGYVCDNPAAVNDDGTVSITLTEQCLAEAGIVLCDVVLRKSGSILSTATFQMRVNESAGNGDVIDSKNEMLILNHLIDEAVTVNSQSKQIVETYETTLEDINESQRISEDAAVSANNSKIAAAESLESIKTHDESAKSSALSAEESKNQAIAAKEEAVSAAANFQVDDTLSQAGKAADAKAVGDALANISINPFPVGALYWSTVDTSPASLFGGTWERIKDRFVLAAGDTYGANTTGGNARITQTTAQAPRHNHTVPYLERENNSVTTWGYKWGYGPATPSSSSVGYSGAGEPMDILPPYVTAYCWKRTA